MMSKFGEKIVCHQCCEKLQESSKSNCCSSCHVWHHFKCSCILIMNLKIIFITKTLFGTKRVSDNQNSIQCDFCQQWLHLGYLQSFPNLLKFGRTSGLRGVGSRFALTYVCYKSTSIRFVFSRLIFFIFRVFTGNVIGKMGYLKYMTLI